MNVKRTLFLAAAAVLLSGCLPLTVWSPDGRQIAVEAHSGLYLFDTGARRLRNLIPGEKGKRLAFGPAWSADSRRLAFFAANGDAAKGSVSLDTLEIETGARATAVPVPFSWKGPDDNGQFADLRGACVVEWHPDGGRLAYSIRSDDDWTGWTVDARGGSPTRLQGAGVSHPTWSPDGKSLLYLSRGDAGYRLTVAAEDGSAPRPLWQPSAGLDIGSRAWWSADSRQVGVFIQRPRDENANPPEEERCQAWVISAADGTGAKLADVPGPAWSATFSRDLRSVVFLQSSKDVALADVTHVAVLTAPYAKPNQLLTQVSGQDGFWIPMLSPDGRTVAVLRGEEEPVLFLAPVGGAPAQYPVPR